MSRRARRLRQLLKSDPVDRPDYTLSMDIWRVFGRTDYAYVKEVAPWAYDKVNDWIKVAIETSKPIEVTFPSSYLSSGALKVREQNLDADGYIQNSSRLMGLKADGVTWAGLLADADRHLQIDILSIPNYLPLAGGTMTGALISQAIYPSGDDSYDLGTSIAEYKDLYVDGVGYLDSVYADALRINTGGSFLPQTDDNVDLGSLTAQFKDAYIDGVAYIDALTMEGDISLGANELVTTKIRIYEIIADTLAILNLAKTAYQSLRVGPLYFYSHLYQSANVAQGIAPAGVTGTSSILNLQGVTGAAYVICASCHSGAVPYFEIEASGDIDAAADNTYDLGDYQKAYKGLLLHDQTDGKDYRCHLDNGAWHIVEEVS